MADANEVEESRFPTLEADRIPLLDDSHVAMRVNLDACINAVCVSVPVAKFRSMT